MEMLKLTLIQSSLHWEDPRSNLSMFEEKIGRLEGNGIVLLPEMFSTGFSMDPERLAEDMNGETVEWMKRICRDKKIILAGSVIIKEDGKYFNRLVWMMPNGQYGIYDKRHLFAYAGEDAQYSSGNKRLISSVNGWKVNLQVCYDLRFPVWARQQSQDGEPEYDLLIYVANWPQKRIHAWKTLLQARAIENQCYVAGVNRVGDDGNGIHYTGESMVVDPLGEIIAVRTDVEEAFTVEIDRKHLQAVRSKIPFLKDADEFEILNTR